MTRILGIDPGMSGGVALIDTEAFTLAVTDMPVEAATKSRNLTSPTGLASAILAASPDYLFLEEVGVRPGEGAVGAFSFGRGFGRIEGVAAGALVPVWLLRPQEWKRALQVPAEKERAVTRAKQLFPVAAAAFTGPRGGLKDGRAEACLIAFYGCLKLHQVPTKPLTLVEFPSVASQA
jgi:crossover junction endodeoxyribonuclease RuvC